MSNPYSPSVVEGESAADLWFERSLFAGGSLGAVAYGLHLAIFGITAYFLLKPANGKILWSFVLYIFLLLTCGTLNVASAIRLNQLTWIDNRDFPGGPAAFSVVMYNVMVDILGDAAYIAANFLADGLLIWRCFVVYGRNYWVVLIPILTFMASTALSILTVFQVAQPFASLWSHSAVIIAIPYWSLSIALNTFVSLIIVARLLWYRAHARQTLSPQHGAMYTGLAAMFVESAALYSVTGLVFIICFARNSAVQNLVLGVLSQVVCIAPELIIMRVALGRAWSADTYKGGGGGGGGTNAVISFNPVGKESLGMTSSAMQSSPSGSGGGRTQVDSSYDVSKPHESFEEEV